MNSFRNKEVYLSGPITGIPNSNKELFKEIENIISPICHRVINPIDFTVIKNNKCFISSAYIKYGIGDHGTWNNCMKIAILNLVLCDVIIMLPGWENSGGARIEHDLAKNLSIPVLYWEQFV